MRVRRCLQLGGPRGGRRASHQVPDREHAEEGREHAVAVDDPGYGVRAPEVQPMHHVSGARTAGVRATRRRGGTDEDRQRSEDEEAPTLPARSSRSAAEASGTKGRAALATTASPAATRMTMDSP